MLRVHLHVYVNVGKLKSALIVSLSQYYKPCNILPDLNTTSCVTAVLAIFEVVVTALFDLEYFIKRFCMCNFIQGNSSKHFLCIIAYNYMIIFPLLQ